MLIPTSDPFTVAQLLELNELDPKFQYSADILHPLFVELTSLGFVRRRTNRGYIWTKQMMTTKDALDKLGLKKPHILQRHVANIRNGDTKLGESELLDNDAKKMGFME